MLLLTTLLLLQSAVPPEAPPLTTLPRCTVANPDEIVVCGTRENRKYRLDPLPEPTTSPLKLETKIGGAKIGVGGEQGEVGGIPTNRVMVRLKIKF